jgi:hypothetical protein
MTTTPVTTWPLADHTIHGVYHTPVVWTDFVGLRTHLEGVLDRSTADAVNAHQQLRFKVQGTADTVQAMQAQFTTFQHSIDQLNQSLAELRQPIVPPPVQPAADLLMMTVSMTMPIY